MTSTAAAPPSRRCRSVSSKTWTAVGLLAIPLWATWPALSLQTWQIPAFECLALVFLVASLVLSLLEQPTDLSHLEPSWVWSWLPALAFAFAMTGSAVFFLMATRYISAAEANLIQFLWPAMVIGLGALFGTFRLKVRYIGGIVLGFAGMVVLSRSVALSESYEGVGLALLGGLSWALYCIFRLKWRRSTGALLARGFGLAAFTCGVLHLFLEPTIVPTATSAVAIAASGIAPGALANWAWDHGFRRGNSQLLTVTAYASPLCSALLLVVLGLESLTPRLLAGASLIVIAALLSHTQA